MVVAVVRKTSNDSQAIRYRGQTRQGLTELDSRQPGADRRQLAPDLFGSLGLRIERIDVGHPATDPQVDHRLGPPGQVTGCVNRVQAETGQRRSRDPQGTGLQHVAAGPPAFNRISICLVHDSFHYAASTVAGKVESVSRMP